MSAMSASELETGPEIAVLQPPPSLNSAVAAVAGSRPALVLRPGKMHAVGSRLAHARQWIVLAATLLVISCSTGATACDPFSTCFDVCSVLFVKSDNGRFVDLGLNGRYVLLPPSPSFFFRRCTIMTSILTPHKRSTTHMPAPSRFYSLIRNN